MPTTLPRAVVAVLVAASFLLGCNEDDKVGELPDAPIAIDGAPDDAAGDGGIDAPPDAPADIALEVMTLGAGAGTITSVPDGILCGPSCTAAFPPDTVVTLTAVAETGSVFAGWGGACSGTTPTCEVTLAQATTVTATFETASYALTVARAGNGAGTVAGTGISCGADCGETYAHGTNVTLTATPAVGSTFTGWSGACSGTATCMVSMTAARNVVATFTLVPQQLTVARAGNGTGTVTGTGINCGTDCTESYNHGTSVTLMATPTTPGSTFTGWSGACTGTGACTVAMTAARSVTATFTLETRTLTVDRAGNGSGAVAGTGISCGTDCTEAYNYGTSVTLMATPATGSDFTGWSGACTGTGTCTVAMTAARSVTATFTLETRALTVALAGNGNGTVTGPGISCGTDCTESYNYGTSVTLTAVPTVPGSTFTGWSGACTGTGSCTVAMTATRAVTATFTLEMETLTVARAGNGNGSVTGTGISCGTDCTETYTYGTSVTLTASPITAGSTFTGWAGACTGTGTCTVAMTAARNVTATFTLDTETLTVGRAGAGTGAVTGTGISCGTDCTETYDYGTGVTLTASPAAGSLFVGWSGDCTGTGTCTLSMTAARNVTATFALQAQTLTVQRAGDGAGTVTGTGINCGTDCTQSYPAGTMVTLTATPSTATASESRFDGWSGACTGTGTCTVTMSAARTVTATFTLTPNLMFVTSSVHTGNLGGLAGADAICQARANGVGLPGTYRAYLSSIDANTPIPAPSRMNGASGWVRVDGVPVVETIDQFAMGALNPPRIHERGADVGNTQFPFAWTGTSSTGTFDSTCSAASVFAPWGGEIGEAMIGIVTATDFRVVATDRAGCGSTMRLYCFGIDRKAQLP